MRMKKLECETSSHSVFVMDEMCSSLEIFEILYFLCHL